MNAQRLANYFPLWSKVRTDPSSLGHRYLSAFAEAFDQMDQDAVKVRDELMLLRPHLGVGQVWFLNLEDDDQFEFSLTSSGIKVPSYHTSVVGNVSATPYTLERDEYFEDMLYGIPTRMAIALTTSVTTFTVWASSSPTVYNAITVPNKLTVKISGSTLWKIRTPRKNPEASNSWFVQITGDDINGISVTETLHVNDDGTYQTEHIFGSVTEVLYDGFNGTVTVLAGEQGVDVVDRYRVAVTPEAEGELLLGLSTASVSGTTRTFLRQYLNLTPNGWEYRLQDGVTPDDNTETITDQVLKTSAGADYTGVDHTISPETGRLYVVDSLGRVHIYEHNLPSFEPPADEPTLSSYIGLIPVAPYAKFGRAEYLWTWFRQPRSNILTVTITRVDPAGTTNYLQANKTWNATPYSFTGTSAVIPEKSWSDFRFTTTYNQVGQWDYYCTVTTELGDETVSHTAVQCGSLTALGTYATGIANPTGIWFSHDGYLCIGKAGTLYRITEYRDTYYADPEAQRLYFREDYDDVEVTP